jgi:hypothetical protein
VDHVGAVRPGPGAQLRCDVLAGVVDAQLRAERVDAGRPQPHQNVVLAGDLGFGQVLQLQDLRPADRRHQDRTHATASHVSARPGQ